MGYYIVNSTQLRKAIELRNGMSLYELPGQTPLTSLANGNHLVAQNKLKRVCKNGHGLANNNGSVGIDC